MLHSQKLYSNTSLIVVTLKALFIVMDIFLVSSAEQMEVVLKELIKIMTMLELAHNSHF